MRVWGGQNSATGLEIKDNALISSSIFKVLKCEIQTIDIRDCVIQTLTSFNLSSLDLTLPI